MRTGRLSTRLAKLANFGQVAGAAREHHASRQQTVVTGTLDFLQQQDKNFFDAGFDDLRQLFTAD